MLPNSGASTTAINRLLASVISICGSALQRIDFADIDRAACAEQGHQDRQTNGGLGGGYGQDEEHEQLSGRITQFTRKPDEIDVHREQHQLDGHQQDDDVLPVEEDAGQADAEQHRAQRQNVAQRDHGLASSPSAGVPSAALLLPCTNGCSTSILTTRRRSADLTMVCSPGFCVLMPVRWRRVSMTAATTATVRMTAANSNGSRYSVNRLRASQVMLEVSAA